MANPAKDMTGLRFGYLTVIRRHGSKQAKGGTSSLATWLCRCDCGKEVVRIGANLRKNNRPNGKHCGCRANYTETHGMTSTRQFNIWAKMLHRCHCPTAKDYADYGGRGITVCTAWRASFETFWENMQRGYEPYLTLGRIDNDGPYSPKNCRWETVLQQARNRRTNLIIDTPKGRMTVAQAAEDFHTSRSMVYQRLANGWPVNAALMTPPYGKRPSSTSSIVVRGTDSSFAEATKYPG